MNKREGKQLTKGA